jgi:hypothetical protein
MSWLRLTGWDPVQTFMKYGNIFSDLKKGGNSLTTTAFISFSSTMMMYIFN